MLASLLLNQPVGLRTRRPWRSSLDLIDWEDLKEDLIEEIQDISYRLSKAKLANKHKKVDKLTKQLDNLTEESDELDLILIMVAL